MEGVYNTPLQIGANHGTRVLHQPSVTSGVTSVVHCCKADLRQAAAGSPKKCPAPSKAVRNYRRGGATSDAETPGNACNNSVSERSGHYRRRDSNPRPPDPQRLYPPENPTLYALNRGFSPRKRGLYKVSLWFGCGIQVVCTPRASQSDARLTLAQPVHEAGRRYGWRELLGGDA